MPSHNVTLRSSEARELADDISTGVFAVQGKELPSDTWVRDMTLWGVLLLTRWDDPNANPSDDEVS
jgi:hypothetical protein